MENQKAFLELELGWVRQIRKGRRVELIAAAAKREQEICAELEELNSEHCFALVASERQQQPDIEG
jgi:hypothetical protein